MIRFGLDPIIFQFGHLQVGWYGLFIALATIAIAVPIALRLGRRPQIELVQA